VDVQTSASPSTPSRTSIGALTHIRIQALQLALKDVSFWYKDKAATAIGPSELTGLLGLELPEKGIDVDLKVRLIPALVTGANSREAQKHFNVIERAEVSISDDVRISVRDTNHAVLVTLFRPMMVTRLREALERTLTEQLRAVVDFADGVAFDISKRRQVFEDTGLGAGGSLMAAIWSEVGRLERERREGPVEMDWRATGTGLVVEQKTVLETNEVGEASQVRKTQFAIGAEPQILTGEKQGPLGTGSEPIKDKLGRMGEEAGVTDAARESSMDVDVEEGAKRMVEEVEARAKGVMKEGQRQMAGFRQSVERKSKLEKGRSGWESAAFDL